MALTNRGGYRYGDSQIDIQEELMRYSESNGYIVQHSANARCACNGTAFQLTVDDRAGAAIRTCVACKSQHPIADSNDYLDGAQLEECACLCGGEIFEITVGVSLYDDSDDVRWLYLGCRCPKCGLTAVYGDWKNEFNGYRELLSRV